MINYLNTYLEADYKLIAIYKEKIFVFEKNGNLNLSQIIKPSDDNNKNFIGINSLKEATALFLEATKFFNNVKNFDFVLGSQITDQSRYKFYEHLKEIENKIHINFCGLKKLKDKI